MRSVIASFPGRCRGGMQCPMGGAHSPDKRIEIATVAPFWEATLKSPGRLGAQATSQGWQTQQWALAICDEHMCRPRSTPRCASAE